MKSLKSNSITTSIVKSTNCLNSIEKLFKSKNIPFTKSDWKVKSEKTTMYQWKNTDISVFQNKTTWQELSIYATKDKIIRVDMEKDIDPLNNISGKGFNFNPKYIEINWKKYLSSIINKKGKLFWNSVSNDEKLINSLIKSADVDWGTVLDSFPIKWASRHIQDINFEQRENAAGSLCFHPTQKFEFIIYENLKKDGYNISFSLGWLKYINATHMSCVIRYLNDKIKNNWLNIEIAKYRKLGNTFDIIWDWIKQVHLNRLQDILEWLDFESKMRS